MPQLPWLTLVSDVDPPTAYASQSPESLARLAGRGAVRLAWDRAQPDLPLRTWQRGLLHTLGLDHSGYASAPIAARGNGGTDPEEFWLHAEPAHFVAGLDQLTFLDLRRIAPVTDSDRTSLFETLRAEFASGDFTLHAFGDDWFIRTTRALQLTTSSPEAAAANELQSVMPRGADAPAVRRLMTEMQMVLHDHPVNEHRARRGLPAVNAIWPWGQGSLATVASARNLPIAFANDAFLRGLYQLNEQTVRPLPESAAQIFSSSVCAEQRIVIAPIATDPVELESRWIAPLAESLARGRLSRLDLVLGEWLMETPRSALRRFWRRPLAPAQWERAP